LDHSLRTEKQNFFFVSEHNKNFPHAIPPAVAPSKRIVAARAGGHRE